MMEAPTDGADLLSCIVLLAINEDGVSRIHSRKSL